MENTQPIKPKPSKAKTVGIVVVASCIGLIIHHAYEPAPDIPNAAGYQEAAQAARERHQAFCRENRDKLIDSNTRLAKTKPAEALADLSRCSNVFSDAAWKAHITSTEKLAAKSKAEEARRIAAQQSKADEEERKRRKREGVHVGMTKADVLASSWGRPQHINRTTTSNGTHEQWVYGGHNYLYFQDGILTAIQN